MAAAASGYYTFFLGGVPWSLPDFGGFVSWVDGLLAAGTLARQATLQVTCGAPPSAARPRAARYSERALREAAGERVTVSVPGAPGRFRFFAYLEGARLRPTPEYVRWLDPQTPERQADTQGPRVAAVSLDPALVAGDRPAADALRLTEQTFVGVGAAYAYGHGTAQVVSSPTTLVAGGRRHGLRVCDIDYRTCIEDVYDHNWLTTGHLTRLGPTTTAWPSARRLEIAGGPALYVRGAALDPQALDSLRALSAPPRAVRRATLLISAAGARRMGLQALRQVFPGTQVSERPGGHVEIDDLESAASDTLGYTRGLERIWREAYGGAGSGLAQEHVIEFASPVDAAHLYYRFLPGTDDEAAAKLRGTPGTCAELRVRFIGRRAEDAQAAVAACQRWRQALEAAPEEYGSVSWAAEPLVEARGVAHLAEMRLDATRLREPAFALLALTLDEANAEGPRVAYAVFEPPGAAA